MTIPPPRRVSHGQSSIRFNWALDWFDGELAKGESAPRAALTILGDTTETYTFAELSQGPRGSPTAAGARRQARRPAAADARQRRAAVDRDAGGDEARSRRDPSDAATRRRGHRRPFRARTRPLCHRRSRRGRQIPRPWRGRRAHRGWRSGSPAGSTTPAAEARRQFRARWRDAADDPLLLYFTSGTTARPKLVLHSHASYPVGHLSTMFGLGLRPATSTSTFPRPAGPSTPGRASLRRGTQYGVRFSRSAAASTRARCSTIS